MAHSPHKRWRGCPMCKYYKHKDESQAVQQPFSALRRIGKKRRIVRRDLGDQDH